MKHNAHAKRLVVGQETRSIIAFIKYEKRLLLLLLLMLYIAVLKVNSTSNRLKKSNIHLKYAYFIAS